MEVGTSEVVGTNPEKIKKAAEKILAGKWKKGGIPQGWDGKASERIVRTLELYLYAQIAQVETAIPA